MHVLCICTSVDSWSPSCSQHLPIYDVTFPVRSKTKRGFTAVDLAVKRGHTAAAEALGTAAKLVKSAAGSTLLVCPPECHLHRTCVEPILRGGEEPPPDNVNRLNVLTAAGQAPGLIPCCISPVLSLLG